MTIGSTILKLDDKILFVDEDTSRDTGHGRGAAAALPLFRSDAQFRIVGELFVAPGAEYTVGEPGERTGTPQATVSREVARLSDAGLVSRRAQGNRTLVSANPDAVIADELRSIVKKLYGPVAALREHLVEVDGIQRAVIFGSFARRWSGEGGPLPRDVDLLVVGDVEPDAIWSVAARLSRDLGIEINPVLRTASEWENDPTGFAVTVKSSPQVEVVPAAPVDAGRD